MSGKSGGRKLAAAVVAGMLIATLSACTPASDVSIRIHDGQLQVAPCQSVNFNAIVFYFEQESAKGGGSIAWETRGKDSSAGSGEIFTYGIAPDGFEDHIAARAPLVENITIGVYFQKLSGGEIQSDLPATFDGDEIQVDTWLNTKRGYTDQPCE